jgi:hypothetical protein
MATTLPQVYTPRQVILSSYHAEDPAPVYDDYTEYKVIDPRTIKEKILDLMGAVLARCWLDRNMMERLCDDPHALLMELGIILPDNMRLMVHRERKNRPQIVIYENQRRICALQMRMFATR